MNAGPAPRRDPSARAALLACAALVVAGGVLRAVPAFGEFWLDEVWTWLTARALHSPLEVFTRVHHSNNNHLNTLVFYALGDPACRVLYRVPSLLAGTATIALAAALAWRRGRLEAILAAFLTAACFALVHFSSEARGYALAVCMALVAALALEAEIRARRPWAAPVFGVATALGFLSHLVFLFFWAGAAAWSGWHLLRARGARASGALRLARLHALPVACFAALYVVDLRHLVVGGGNPTHGAELVARTLGFSLGLPVVPALALPYALFAGAILAATLWRMRNRGDDAWILYAVAIAVAPLLALVAFRPAVVAVRYFLIGIALFLVLAAGLLADGLRRGGAARVAAAALLVLFALGNARHTAAFLEHGRGGYREALLFMARETAAPRIVVGSDHDFRNGAVLQFYERELPPGKTLDYRTRSAWPPGGPEWLLVHRAARPEHPRAEIRDPEGNRYALAAEFDHAAISGFYCALYRNAAGPGTSGG